MKLFNRKKDLGLTPRQEAVAGALAARLVRAQRRLAVYVNGKTRGWSRRVWLLALCLFCLLAGAGCLWLILMNIH